MELERSKSCEVVNLEITEYLIVVGKMTTLNIWQLFQLEIFVLTLV